jgi:hypothetical protein
MFAAGVAAAAAAGSSSDAQAAPAPRFWRPGTIAPGSNVEREPDASASAEGDASGSMLLPAAVFGTSATARLPIRQQRMLLPIAGHRRQLLYALERHQVLVLVGATGSGSVSLIDFVATHTHRGLVGTLKRNEEWLTMRRSLT